MAITQVVAVRADNGTEYNTVPPNKSEVAGGNGGSATRVTNTTLIDGVGVSRYNDAVFASTVINGNDSDPALMVGTFAYNNQKPVAKRVSETLSGVANSVLQSGAAQPSLIQSIHYIKVNTGSIVQGVRSRRLTSAIRAGKFNQFTGEFEAGYPVVAADTFDNDHAALPTRLVPGELTYKTNSLEPLNDDYKEKTG